MLYFGISVILLSVFCDGLADGSFHVLPWHKGTAWDWYHIWKRIRLMLPPVFILYIIYPPWWVAVLVCVGSWAVWQAGMRLVGKSWRSMWLRWLP